MSNAMMDAARRRLGAAQGKAPPLSAPEVLTNFVDVHSRMYGPAGIGELQPGVRRSSGQ